ncbi:MULTISPECIES: hypothetical protein [Streptomyces]|nr:MULTISPECIES: hypothetical protein [unclassified Streptomyces]SCD39738.1 hypothetical protein GA0115241_101682 [Streptomyces sp. DpondAA-D4]
MTAAMVEISPRPPVGEESEGVVLLDDLEALTEGAVPGCNDDNPYT